MRLGTASTAAAFARFGVMISGSAAGIAASSSEFPFHSLTEDEKLALAALLTRTIEDERNPLSPRAFAG